LYVGLKGVPSAINTIGSFYTSLYILRGLEKAGDAQEASSTQAEKRMPHRGDGLPSELAGALGSVSSARRDNGDNGSAKPWVVFKDNILWGVDESLRCNIRGRRGLVVAEKVFESPNI